MTLHGDANNLQQTKCLTSYQFARQLKVPSSFNKHIGVKIQVEEHMSFQCLQELHVVKTAEFLIKCTPQIWPRLNREQSA